MRTIIFKAIEKCNANCIYCDVIKKEIHDVMNFELLELILKKMNSFLMNNPNEKISFLLHGGEIGLLGSEYFRKLKQLLIKHCKTTNDRIKIIAQSNLTVINQDQIDAIKDLGITSLGTSYELIPNIRGIGKSRNTRKYNSLFFKGIDLLRKNNMKFGIIYVVNKESLSIPKEIFFHLTNIAYDNQIKFNCIHKYGENDYGNELGISEEEYAHFLGEVFKQWWKYKYTLPMISPFRNIYYAVTENKFCFSCTRAGNCSSGFVYIDPLGNIHHCCSDGDHSKSPRYSNIVDKTFDEIYNHPFRQELSNRNILLPQGECKLCPYWKICNGGCPFSSYHYKGNINYTNGCKTTKIFIKEYFEPITGLKVNMHANITYLNNELDTILNK